MDETDNRDAEEKSSWWYWFKKLDGNMAECNNCDWVKDRGPARSTSILRSHLRSKHKELFMEKLEADKLIGNPNSKFASSKKRKLEELRDVKDEISEDGAADYHFPLRSQISDSTLVEGSPVKSLGSDHCSFQLLEQDLGLELDERSNNRHKLNNALITMMMDSLGMCAVNNASTSNSNEDGTNYPTDNDQKNTLASVNHGGLEQNGGIVVPQTSKATYSGQALAQTVGQPIVKMCRIEYFSAAHRLHNPNLSSAFNQQIYGKCNSKNGHGHNYTWKVVLEGPVDTQTGMVYDLAALKREMAEVLELVDHKNLDKDVPYFREGVVSTTENLAVFLFDQLAAKMNAPTLLKKVVVNETDKNSFSYSGKFSR